MARSVARAFNIETLDLMAHFLPERIEERPALTLKDINLIGRRIRSGWSEYEHDRQAGRFTFTSDGLHLMPETAVEIAEIVIDFLNLC